MQFIVHLLTSRFHSHALLPLCFPSVRRQSEILLLLKKHPKANNRAINQQSTRNAHNHRWYPDDFRMG